MLWVWSAPPEWWGSALSPCWNATLRFQLTVVAASARSAGKPYEEAVGHRWAMPTPIPEEAKSLVVMDAQADKEKIANAVDFIFCAVDMKKEEVRALEEA